MVKRSGIRLVTGFVATNRGPRSVDHVEVYVLRHAKIT